VTASCGWRASGHCLAAGEACGPAIVLSEPLSLWGGLDAETGLIVGAHHPQAGSSVQGRVLVMPGGRGSSSSSSVLAEAIRRQTGPAAIVLLRPDEILAVGSLVGAELYGRALPIIVIDADTYEAIHDGDTIRILAGPHGTSLEGRPGETV
jgi:uncharacterized protein